MGISTGGSDSVSRGDMYLAMAAAALAGAIVTMMFCLATASHTATEPVIIEHATHVHTDSLLSKYMNDAREKRRNGSTRNHEEAGAGS